jgi:hypothetical protein
MLLVGLILVVLPVILFQADPVTPLNRSWKNGQYRLICILLGALGGALIAKRNNGGLGFRWAAGAVAGALTAGLSYQASEKVYENTEEPSVNIFIILICSLPGLVAFLVVKRCSDYSFPEQSTRHQQPASAITPEASAWSGKDFPAKQTTPLLLATKI